MNNYYFINPHLILLFSRQLRLRHVVAITSVGFLLGSSVKSRVEGQGQIVEGKMSRVISRRSKIKKMFCLLKTIKNILIRFIEDITWPRGKPESYTGRAWSTKGGEGGHGPRRSMHRMWKLGTRIYYMLILLEHTSWEARWPPHGQCARLWIEGSRFEPLGPFLEKPGKYCAR